MMILIENLGVAAACEARCANVRASQTDARMFTCGSDISKGDRVAHSPCRREGNATGLASARRPQKITFAEMRVSAAC